MVRFLCDSMLGSLAKRLRIAGIDAELAGVMDSKRLLVKAAEECRTVLTRRTVFLKLKVTVPLYFVSPNNVQSQFDDVLRHFKIQPDAGMLLSRCLVCNKLLIKISKNNVSGLVPEYIYNTNNEFSTCPECKKIYWKGTHYMNILKHFSSCTLNDTF